MTGAAPARRGATPGAPTPSITADLRLVVDGTHATVRADGPQLTVRTENAGRLMASALEAVRAMPAGSAPRGALRDGASRTSRLLDDSGLSARLVGRHGTVLELGRGSGSRPARLLLHGSPITLGSTSALIWTGAEYARAAGTHRRAGYAWAASVITALTIRLVAARTRRASHAPASTRIATRNG